MEKLPAKKWLPELSSNPETKREKAEDLRQRAGNRFTAVIDDDPTGIQTVHGVSVYMNYAQPLLEHAVKNDRLFFIQTNSRAMTSEQAFKTNSLIMERLVDAAQKAGKDFSIISRSDSTLRGHYPCETQALRETYEKLSGKPIDGEILIPFFPEGGRFTIGDVHYVKEGDFLVPAAQTEFARDKTFGYRNSDLKKYISEKYNGLIKAEDVMSISLEELRSQSHTVYEKLIAMSGFRKMIVNAVTYNDLSVFTDALWRAEDAGKIFIYRSASSFVRAYGAIGTRKLLSSEEMLEEGPKLPGLVVVGSHVNKTTNQLEKLFVHPKAVPIEINVPKLLKNDTNSEKETVRCAAAIENALISGKLPVLFTSRTVVSVQNGAVEKNLEIAFAVSSGVVRIVRSIKTKPGFIIAKGGITSSDIASKALGIKKALVLGQVRPGIPVVRCEIESRWPGIPYIIFPGNVGSKDDLYNVAAILTG